MTTWEEYIMETNKTLSQTWEGVDWLPSGVAGAKIKPPYDMDTPDDWSRSGYTVSPYALLRLTAAVR